MTYPNYPSDVVKDTLKNTRKYAGDPHALLIAYVLSSIKELLDEDKDLWGAKVPTEILDRYIDSCYDDFMNAAYMGTTIKIEGNGYRVRKIKDLSIEKARQMFSFPTEDDYSIICAEGVFDVRKKVAQTHQEQSDSYKINRFYFWKVMAYANGTDEQWDKLTDMEIAMFCWAMWIKKLPYSAVVNDDMIQEWWEHEYEYFELPLDEIKGCFATEICDSNKLNTYFAFDYYKVKEWNNSHNVKSEAEKLSDMEAYDNWYNTLSKRFIRKQ